MRYNKQNYRSVPWGLDLSAELIGINVGNNDIQNYVICVILVRVNS